VVGDFNHDGKLDLAYTGVGSVIVILGNGHGTFRPPRSFDAGISGSYLAVADLNGDGRLDLVVTDGQTVSVLLGTRHAHEIFQPPRIFDPGVGVASVAVGDFNGDGVPDLAGIGVTSVSLLLGNGDGTFQPGRSFSVAPHQPTSLGVGDFNGDAAPDIVTLNHGTNTGSILLGNGDGTFQPARIWLSGNGYTGTANFLAVADFNGDGVMDVAWTIPFHRYPPPRFDGDWGHVVVALGSRDGFRGTFASMLFNPYFVAAGDFDGDGLPDLVVGVGDAGSYHSRLSVFLSNGDGNFSGPWMFGPMIGPVAAGDFNGDGLLDLVGSGGRLMLNNTHD
jgi:hypothetical protein